MIQGDNSCSRNANSLRLPSSKHTQAPSLLRIERTRSQSLNKGHSWWARDKALWEVRTLQERRARTITVADAVFYSPPIRACDPHPCSSHTNIGPTSSRVLAGIWYHLHEHSYSINIQVNGWKNKKSPRRSEQCCVTPSFFVLIMFLTSCRTEVKERKDLGLVQFIKTGTKPEYLGLIKGYVNN